MPDTFTAGTTGTPVMPDLTVVSPHSPSPLARLVDDYLMACRARGLAKSTCGCREPRPPSSSDQPVFMDEATQTIGSS